MPFTSHLFSLDSILDPQQNPDQRCPLESWATLGSGACTQATYPFPLRCLCHTVSPPQGFLKGGVARVTQKAEKGRPAGTLQDGSSRTNSLSAGQTSGNPGGVPHLHVAVRRLRSCPCLSVTASGTISVSPGRRGMACGRRSRMGRNWALGRTWPPGTPSSQGVC